MRTNLSNRLRRSQGSRSRAKRFAPARDLPIEALEQRTLLSISTASFVAPRTVPGNTWTYAATANGINGTFTQTVVGPVTFNGVSATEIDSNTNGVLSGQDYYGTRSDGAYVSYGENSYDSGSGSDRTMEVYSPALAQFGATLSANVPYTSSSVETDTFYDGSGNVTMASATDDDSSTATLLSETPTPMQFGAQTYPVYQIAVSETDTPVPASANPPTTSSVTEYFSPGVGLVEAVSGAVTYTLTSFTGSADHLVFSTEPAQSVQPNAALKPAVVVEAENASGDVDTAASGTVTLALLTTSGTGSLAGTVSQQLAGGTASFAGLSVSSAGAYQLQASDSDDTTAATSSLFEVTNDRLVFTEQPRSGDIEAPIVFTVSAYTAKNKLDPDASGNVSVALDALKQGQGAALTGDTSVSLVDGRADFTTGDDDAVADIGQYELAATLGTDAATDAAVAPADLHPAVASNEQLFEDVSKPFSLSGFQLVFTGKIPSKDDPNSPIAFAVTLEDKEHKVVTADDGNFVTVTDAVNDSRGPSVSYTTPYAPLVNGVATFNASSPLTFKGTGTFAIKVEEASSIGDTLADDVVVSHTAGAASHGFVVEPLHLVFLEQPSTEVENDPVSFQVAVDDFQDKTVLTEDAEQIDVPMVYQIVPDKAGTSSAVSQFISDGTASFTASTGIIFGQAGTYYIEVREATSAATATAPIQYASYTKAGHSKIFRVINSPTGA